MTGIGFRILPIPKRPDRKLVAELGKMVTPHLSDSMERLYAGRAAAAAHAQRREALRPPRSR